jgi:Tol biopolymer transport system component
VRRVLPLLAALALLAPVATAQATYAGKNGPIVFSKNGDIWSVKADGSGLKRIINGGDAALTEPSVSPNGRLIALEVTEPAHTAEIFVSDLKGKHARWITKAPSKSGKWLSFHSPTWSPNGKRVAFACDAFSGHTLCSTDTHGGGFKKLMSKCTCAGPEPDWGKTNKIAFIDAYPYLSVVSGNGGKAKRLPIAPIDDKDAYGYEHPSWSPSGKQILFDVADTNTAIDVVDASGANHRRLITSANFGQDPTDYDYPAWAPDGKSIALHVTGLGPSQGGLPEGLYTMALDGSGLTMRSSAMTGQYPEPYWARKPK